MTRPRSTTRTLPEQIADELGAALVAGKLPSGQRLLEQELADRFAVSRGPIREALRLLERRGIVTLTPRRGAYVRELTMDAIADLFNVRNAISALAARQAAIAPVASYVEALKRRCAELDALAADPDADAGAFADVATRAVRAVVKASGNEQAIALMAQLAEHTVWRIIWEWPLDYATAERRRHQARALRGVLEAIEKGDADAADLRLRQALEESRDHAVRTLVTLRAQPVDASRLLRTAPRPD
ncbi:MAG: GntR family transcriptional regulator [Burkholderiaceae bacterium]